MFASCKTSPCEVCTEGIGTFPRPWNNVSVPTSHNLWNAIQWEKTHIHHQFILKNLIASCLDVPIRMLRPQSPLTSRLWKIRIRSVVLVLRMSDIDLSRISVLQKRWKVWRIWPLRLWRWWRRNVRVRILHIRNIINYMTIFQFFTISDPADSARSGRSTYQFSVYAFIATQYLTICMYSSTSQLPLLAIIFIFYIAKKF